MNERLLAVGLATTIAGLVGLGTLAVRGVIRHPPAAAASYGPAEFAVIGGSFLVLTVGVLVTFRSLVVFPEHEE